MRHPIIIRFLTSFAFLNLLLWVGLEVCTYDVESPAIVSSEIRTHAETGSSLPYQKNIYLLGHQGEQSIAFSERHTEYSGIQNLDDHLSSSNKEDGASKRRSLYIKNSALIDLSASTYALIYPFHFHL